MDANVASLLDEALESWEFARDGVIDEARAIPAERFDWRPADGARSVTELIHHIVESAHMAAGELSRPDGDFRRAPPADILAEYAGTVSAVSGKDNLLTLLRTSLDADIARIRTAGELAMLQYIRRFDGKHGTRMAWLWHAIDHESYHRGQLALYVRSMGLVPALTRLIHGG